MITNTNHSDHPNYLTSTERRRFFRVYYQLWGLLRLADAGWASAIKTLPIKDVYLMRETVRIPLPIGADQPLQAVREHFPDFVWYDDGRRGELGELLQKSIERYVEETGRGYAYWWIDMTTDMHPNGAYAGFRLLWDHSSRRLNDWCLEDP